MHWHLGDVTTGNHETHGGWGEDTGDRKDRVKVTVPDIQGPLAKVGGRQVNGK